MLNFNLNIIGAGVGKNKSTYDPRLFIAMLEDFYTASLQANARFDVVVSGSTIYNEPRNFKTSITSSATPSTQEEFVVVGQTTYLIERTSGVTASLYGFPKWDPVQFGDPSIFNNVTMSLEIPGIGYSSSSYGTGSFLEHKFVAEPKATYFIDAKIIFGDYYNVTLNEHFNQSSSFQQQLQLTGSKTGFLTENAYTSSTSGLNNKINIAESGSLTLKQNGVGTWDIIHDVPLTPQFSQSLVTMSLESPYSGFTYTYNTQSVNEISFSASQFTLSNNAAYHVTASVNTKNPFIPIEYLIVGGGQFGDRFGTNKTGGGGGYTKWGIINLESGSNSITASAGYAGGAWPEANPTNGGPSYMYWKDNTTGLFNTASALGGNFRTRAAICGVSINEPTTWVDGQQYGANGVGGQISFVSQSQCNTPSSSYVPGFSGVGGFGTPTTGPEFQLIPQGGLVAIRYYDPNNFYSASLSGSGIVTNVSGGYHYHYFVGSAYGTFVNNISTIEFHFEPQEYIVDIPSVPTASGFSMDYLLVGGGAAGGNGAGGGGGGAGELLSGSTTIPANGYFNTTISIGAGGIPFPEAGWQGYPGFRSTMNGSIQATANGGGGGLGNLEASTFDSYGGSNAPGGGSGGGGCGRQNGGLAPAANYANGNIGGVGQWYGNNVAFGGGGGGAFKSGSGGELQGGFGGSGSMWLDGNIYAGGGAGGRTMDAPTGSAYIGGPGGGGAGGLALNVAPYTQGTLPGTGSANTGAGGGGSGLNSFGAAGGSGVAIFRLLTSDYNFLTASNHIATGSNVDTYTSSSYTFIRAKGDTNVTIFNSIN